MEREYDISTLVLAVARHVYHHPSFPYLPQII